MVRWSRLAAVVAATVLAILVLLGALPRNTITNLVAHLPDNYLLFTGALAALGTLTMAVIQTFKDLVPILRWYQEAKTQHWLRLKAAEAAKIAANQQSSPRELVKQRLMRPYSVAFFAPELHEAFYPRFSESDAKLAYDAEADLLRLATAGDRAAFYDLPIEQLCGQMNAASQVAVDYPDLHEPLLNCLASLANPEDRKDFATPALRNELAGLQKQNQRSSADEQRIAEIQQQLADARGRIANQIHRSIDAFQISVGYRWNWYLRIASFLISFAITDAALAAGLGSTWIGSHPADRNWAVIVLIGLIGGFLAPVTSDLQAIVRQIRQKT